MSPRGGIIHPKPTSAAFEITTHMRKYHDILLNLDS